MPKSKTKSSIGHKERVIFISIFLFLICVFITVIVLNQRNAIRQNAQTTQVSLSGTYEVIWKEESTHTHASGSSDHTHAGFDYFLRTNTEFIPLKFINGDPPQYPHSVVTAYGKREGNTLVIDLKQQNSFVITQNDASTQIYDALSPWKVAIVMFNFADDTSRPMTTTEATNVLYSNSNSVNNYFKEVSFGKFSIIGKNSPQAEVHDWVTIPLSKGTTCDWGSWHTAAKTELQNRGVDLSGYQSLIFLHPAVSTCGHAGLGAINGQDGDINGETFFNTHVIVHEIAHGMGPSALPIGLGHTYIYRCTDSSGKQVALSASCVAATGEGSGDWFDPLGHIYDNHYHGYHKARLGWIPTSSIQTVTSSGEYTIAPLEKSTSGTQLIRVPRDQGAVPTYVYVEFRQSFGFDNFPSTAPAVNGVILHFASDLDKDFGNWVDSYLIDTVPETATGEDAPLVVGKTFTDPVSKISIRPKSVSSSQAVVEIAVGGNALPTLKPSVVTPTYVCAGSINGVCITPTPIPTQTVTQTPDDPTPTIFGEVTPSVGPTISGTAPFPTFGPSDSGSGGSGGIIELFLRFIFLILQFFMSLFGR